MRKIAAGRNLLLALAALCLLASGWARAEEIGYEAYLSQNAGLTAAVNSYTLLSGEDMALSENQAKSFHADIKEPGLYAVQITYTAAPGAAAPVEAQLMVDGQVPYRQAGSLSFLRLWESTQGAMNGFQQDENGNDLRPALSESVQKQTVYVQDASGYVSEPLLLALPAGSHEIALKVTRESLLLHALSLVPPPSIPEYQRPAGEDASSTLRVQGEAAAFTTDASITPQSDRASALTEPNRGALISLNMIGGTAFSKPRSAITWKVEAPQSGLYELRLRFRQNYSHAFFALRTLYVDGQIPFVEGKAIPFYYAGGWQVKALGGDTPYLIYLSKGSHLITLEATLGDQADALNRAREALNSLNGVYTRILMLTGADPDPLRDYGLETKLPGELAKMGEVAGTLREIIASLVEKSVTKGSDMVPVERLIRQLDLFADSPFEIPGQFESFKTNLSSLGEWIQNASNRALDIDYMELAAPGSPMPQAEAGFFRSIAYQAQLFFDSFSTDYARFDSGSEGGNTITVWVGGSRDRAQLLNDMIRTEFTPSTGIHVNLQLVQGDYVVPSVSVGSGPDVLLGGAMGDPVNYASRHAAFDLNTFPDFEEVAAQFLPEAVTPFRFDGGVYALPETMSFPVMFVRDDIMESLGIKPPNTWDDLIQLIPVLSRSNMQFLVDARVGTEVYGSLTALSIFLYQNGGEVYTADGTASALDSEIAIASFKQLTKLYTAYGMPYNFNTATRFRSGEAPIVLCDYGLYNTLMVSAPEISGLWRMLPIPGTVNSSGNLNRSARIVVTGNMILKGCKDPESAWTFLKWLAQAQTQAGYSRQLEGILGSAARYPAANLEAFRELNWTPRDLNALEEQMVYAKAVPEVPGGYYTTWHVENAFRAVVLSGEDPREALLDYVRVINDEIDAKREELGLALAPDGGAAK